MVRLAFFPRLRCPPRAAARGLTLIELMVAMGLIAVLFGAVVIGVGSILGTKARGAAGELSAVIRSLYDTASLTGKTCRLVFEMPLKQQEDGETKYWAECAAGNVTTQRDRDAALMDERKRQELEAREGPKKKAPNAMGAYTGDEPTLQELMNQEKERVGQAAKYSSFTSPEIEPKTLPNGVELSVWTRHQSKPATEGTAYLYFFPQGYTEKAMVFVKQGDNVWTISVSPLSGKTRIDSEALEIPRS